MNCGLIIFNPHDLPDDGIKRVSKVEFRTPSCIRIVNHHQTVSISGENLGIERLPGIDIVVPFRKS
jgi:hypothetical protein